MKHLTVQSVGTMLAVESVHAVAVYHKKDGRVCHLHHVITLCRGRTPPSTRTRTKCSRTRGETGARSSQPRISACSGFPSFRPQVSGRPQAQGVGGRGGPRNQEEENQEDEKEEVMPPECRLRQRSSPIQLKRPYAPRTGCDVMTPKRSIARWNGASLSSDR
jgi:hypothetical protein